MNFAESQELGVHIKHEYLNDWRQNESIKISVLSEAVRNEAQLPRGSVSSRALSSINRLVRDIGSRLGLRSEPVNENSKSTFSPTINIRRCLFPFMCIPPYPTEKPIHSHQLPTLAIADDLAVIAQTIAEKIVPRCEVFGNIYRSVLKEIESVDLLTTKDCSTRQANVSDPVGSLCEDLERHAANMEWFQKSAHFTPLLHVPS
ncbi:hypothetical protein K474DRAFT_1667381 [Panus rudis PR-1116 ss-1]|nr:hypothetical protein K474DRAFT_1667381 [Panus rudis PR-1116 ss-1]